MRKSEIIRAVRIGLLIGFFFFPADGTTGTFSVDRDKPLLSEQAGDIQEQGRTIQNENRTEAPKKDVDEGGIIDDPAVENKPEPVLDRRWIIKMRDEKPKETNPPKPRSVQWAGNDQKKLCESYLIGIREAFDKARYYSIGGDSCSTGRFSKSFIDQAKQCKKDCPEGYLEASGFTEPLIRNMNVLYDLGVKRCLKGVGGQATDAGSRKSEREEQKERRKEEERERSQKSEVGSRKSEGKEQEVEKIRR